MNLHIQMSYNVK